MNNSQHLNNTATKKAILDIARKLFFQKGYDRTTLQDIASPLGFETPNLYNYFRSKEHLLYEIIKDAHIKVLAVTRQWTDKDINPVEKLRLVVEDSFKVVVNWTEYNNMTVESYLVYLTPTHLRTILRMREKYNESLQEIIRGGIESHEFSFVDERLAAIFMASIIIRSALWFSQKGKLTPSEVGNLMFDFVFRGLKGC